MSAFVSGIAASTAATSTATVVTAAFTTSGSNRAISVGISVGSSGAQTATPSRGSDTGGLISEQTTTNLRVYLKATSNEPQTASAALTVTRGAATTYWGFTVIVADGVDQTTRITNVTLNADVSTNSGLDTLSVPNSSGDLVADFFGTRGGYNGTALVPSGSQTDRAGFQTGTASFDQANRASTRAGTGSNVDMSWSGFATGAPIYHIGYTFKNGASTPPVNTVTSTSNTIIAPINADVAVPAPPTVAAGTSAITSVVMSCDAGNLQMNASGSVTINNNGTASVTLLNGASASEYNTVLGTMTHSRTTHGVTTFTIVSSDGTLNDSDNFTRFVSPAGLTITGTHAQVRAAIASVLLNLDVDETTGTIEIIATDSGDRTDTQVLTLNAIPVDPPPGGGGGGSGSLPLLIIRVRRRTRSR